jgi:hypothetical protein
MISRAPAKYHLVSFVTEMVGKSYISAERPTPLWIVAKQVTRPARNKRDADFSERWDRIGWKQVGRYGSEILGAKFVRKVTENASKLRRMVPLAHELECTLLTIKSNRSVNTNGESENSIVAVVLQHGAELVGGTKKLAPSSHYLPERTYAPPSEETRFVHNNGAYPAIAGEQWCNRFAAQPVYFGTGLMQLPSSRQNGGHVADGS